MSTIFFDQVIVMSEDSTASRVMLGAPVGGLNEGVTTASQGLLVPSVAPQVTLPQLTATAYLDGVALDPQPSFKWESSNPGVCAVDQAGNCSRVVNDDASSFDSNGGVSVGQLGGISNIRATALRPDGSVSGVWGEVTVAVQAQAPRQFGVGGYANPNPAGASSPSSATGFYGLVE
jgi:hypothetical protein